MNNLEPLHSLLNCHQPLLPNDPLILLVVEQASQGVMHSLFNLFLILVIGCIRGTLVTDVKIGKITILGIF